MKPCAWTLYSCSLLNASDTESNSRSNSFKLNTVKLGPFRKATFIGGWGGGGGGGRVARELGWGRVLTSIPSIIWFSGVQQSLNFQVQSRDH